ncbi:hypothetical protein [Methylobacterium durans]|uniref:hypothetical protein n=1 Tax=Methylobacterium durans TaxID=2202825 RepID=UPI0013A5A463|nr:hypothetical protein [Methylobacterium durans]
MSKDDPKAPQDVIAEVPAGTRPYQSGDVADRPQGPWSPGQSEPGDMGAFDNKEYEEPQHESTKGDGESGYRGG